MEWSRPRTKQELFITQNTKHPFVSLDSPFSLSLSLFYLDFIKGISYVVPGWVIINTEMSASVKYVSSFYDCNRNIKLGTLFGMNLQTPQ